MLIIPSELADKVDFFAETHKDIIYSFFIEKFKQTLREGNNVTILYGIEATNITVAIPEDAYSDLLHNMMEFFTEEEMYEKAGQCYRLINQFQIEEVLKG